LNYFRIPIDITGEIFSYKRRKLEGSHDA